MKSKLCEIQIFDGSHCSHPPVIEGKCFWHAKIEKTDETVHKYFPHFNSLQMLLDEEKPNLEKADFTKNDLKNIDFSNLNLRGAYFDKANLQCTNFTNANLESAFLRDSDLSYSDLTKASLKRASLVRAIVKHAKLIETDLSQTKLNECDLSYSEFRGNFFQSTKFHFTNLYKTSFEDVKFSNKSAQLKFTNTTSPTNEEHFLKQSIKWTEISEYSSAIQAIEFYFRRFNQNEFNNWIKTIFSITQDKMLEIKQSRDFQQTADLLDFIVKIYKITGYSPKLLALPEPKVSIKSQSDNKVIFSYKFQSNNIEISWYNFLIFRLKNLILSLHHLAHHVEETNRIAISSINFNSPLEIILVLSPAAVIPLLFKSIHWYQDAVLKGLSIKHKKLEIIKSKLELEKLPIEKEKALIELNKLLEENDIIINKEEEIKLITDIHNYYAQTVISDNLLSHEITSGKFLYSTNDKFLEAKILQSIKEKNV
jgi:uncharacterized protein YjbI with pentapeptide repeats